MDEDTGEREGLVDVSSVQTHITAQLVLPQRFLDYGYYELQYSVSMSKAADEVPFDSSVSTFIQIVR